MTPKQLFDFCMKKNGAYEDYPFGPDVTVVKVEKRIFAQIFRRNGIDYATLNCDMMTGQFYRQMFPGTVVRGYHCPPVQQPYFNTFPLNELPDDTIFEIANHSYLTVVGKLPKYVQKRLADEETKLAE